MGTQPPKLLRPGTRRRSKAALAGRQGALRRVYRGIGIVTTQARAGGFFAAESKMPATMLAGTGSNRNGSME